MCAFKKLPRLLEVSDLVSHLEAPELILVDLGSATRYSQGHIPGARHLDIARTHCTSSATPGLLPEIQELQQLFAALGHSGHAIYVLYDDDGGTAAGRFAWVLDSIGHPHWHFLQGGLAAWLAHALPLSQTAPAIHSSNVQLTMDNRYTASCAYVQEHYADMDVVVWDARSLPEYQGQQQRAARVGHIPEAIHLEWSSLLDPKRPLYVRSDAAALLAAHGITPDKEIITHCHTHRRSGFTYLVARALGYPRIKAYAGSWSEWGNHPTLPIAL